MGHLLFWLEAAVTSALFAALGVALASHITDRVWRGLLRLVWAVLLLGPWLVAIGAFAWVQHWAGGARRPLIASTVAGAAVLIAATIIRIRGRRAAATAWPVNRLALAWVAGVFLTVMTFWNLDLAVRQRMATLRVEAGAIALSLAPPRVPDAQNAAPLYRRASEILEARKAQGLPWWKVSYWFAFPYAADEFDPADEEVLSLLAQSRPVIDLLHRAAERPACNFGVHYSPPSLRVTMAWPSSIPDLGGLLSVSARVAASEGRMADAMADLHAAWAISRHCTAEPPIIATLIGVSAEDKAFDAFQYVLDQGPLPVDALDAGPDLLTPSYREALHRGVLMNTALGMATFASMPDLIAESVVRVHPQLPEFPLVTARTAAPYRVFLWKEDLEAHLGWMRRYEQLSSEPYYKNERLWRDLDRRLSQTFLGPDRTFSETFLNQRESGLMTRCLTFPLARASKLAALADARHRLVALAIAAERYRQAEGVLPTDLDQLVPRYVLLVLTDPFTGEPLKLVAAADGIVLYSLGPDLADDGGAAFERKYMTGDVSLRLRRW